MPIEEPTGDPVMPTIKKKSRRKQKITVYAGYEDGSVDPQAGTNQAYDPWVQLPEAAPSSVDELLASAGTFLSGADYGTRNLAKSLARLEPYWFNDRGLLERLVARKGQFPKHTDLQFVRYDHKDDYTKDLHSLVQHCFLTVSHLNKNTLLLVFSDPKGVEYLEDIEKTLQKLDSLFVLYPHRDIGFNPMIELVKLVKKFYAKSDTPRRAIPPDKPKAKVARVKAYSHPKITEAATDPYTSLYGTKLLDGYKSYMITDKAITNWFLHLKRDQLVNHFAWMVESFAKGTFRDDDQRVPLPEVFPKRTWIAYAEVIESISRYVALKASGMSGFPSKAVAASIREIHGLSFHLDKILQRIRRGEKAHYTGDVAPSDLILLYRVVEASYRGKQKDAPAEKLPAFKKSQKYSHKRITEGPRRIYV